MNIQLSFRHFHSSESVKQYASEKSEKLKKFFDGKVSVTWNFDRRRDEFIAHCHIVGNHIDYFGEAETTDIYASIDKALERIERQLRKKKELVKNKLHRGDRVA